MAGLDLRGGVRFGAYSPMTPAAALTNTASGFQPTGSTISQMAYGINGTGSTQISGMPAYGAVGIGIAATAFLVFLWWSLPR